VPEVKTPKVLVKEEAVQYTKCFTWNTKNRQRSLAVVVSYFIAVIWQAASSSGLLQSRVLPAPTAVVSAFWHLLISGELWHHVKVSAGRALLGLLVGGGLGLLLGLLNGSSRIASTLLDTTLQMIRNIPALALIPLVILWFGIDETAKLF
jgi:sulfonate transport system permease protein